MAEEEVLTEQESPKKKDRSGMSPMIILVVVVLGFAVIAGLIVMVMGKIGKGGGETMARPEIAIEACEDKYKVINLSEEQLKFKLKDDRNYLLAKVALCVEAKTTEDMVATKYPPMVTVMNEFFLGYTSEDIFGQMKAMDPAAGGAAEAPEENIFEPGDEGPLGEEAVTPQEKFRTIRERLADNLRANFKNLHIIDIYLYEYEPAKTPF